MADQVKRYRLARFLCGKYCLLLLTFAFSFLYAWVRMTVNPWDGHPSWDPAVYGKHPTAFEYFLGIIFTPFEMWLHAVDGGTWPLGYEAFLLFGTLPIGFLYALVLWLGIRAVAGRFISDHSGKR